MILLDTHSTLWTTFDQSRLSPPALATLQETRQVNSVIAIACSTLWEIAFLSSRGRIFLPSSTAVYLRHLESLFTVLPITSAVAEQSTLFSTRFPNDPTDRLIASTAVVNGLRLVTKDRQIRESGEVDCIW